MKRRLQFTVFLVAITSVALAKLPISNELSDEFAQVVKRVNPAVVTITSERVIKGNEMEFNFPFQEFFGDDFFHRFFGPEWESRSQVLGSGVIVDAGKGYVLTNNHVVAGAEEISIFLIDEREFKAEVIGSDAESDLAVLKIEADNLVGAELGNSDELEVGEWVLAIGSPFSKNLSHSVTAGIVSAKGRSRIISGTRYEDFIQTDAAINPGNSGGALVNLDGELVGINTAIATGGYSAGNVGIGFAIPINLAKTVMTDLINEGRVIRAWLGVYIQDVDDGIAKGLGLESREGAIVTKVVEDSPAEKADIEVEDVIVEFDGKKVRDTAHLKNLVSTTRPGTRADVEVIRKGKLKTLRVKLTELPRENVILASESKSSTKLGLRVEDISSTTVRDYGVDPDEKGVVVIGVARNGKAARAGIRRGDVIKRVGTVDITSVKEYKSALKDYGSKDTILFLLKRRGGSIFVPVENG